MGVVDRVYRLSVSIHGGGARCGDAAVVVEKDTVLLLLATREGCLF